MLHIISDLDFAVMWEKRKAYSVHVGKTEGERPRGRLRRKWEGNTKVDLK